MYIYQTCQYGGRDSDLSRVQRLKCDKPQMKSLDGSGPRTWRPGVTPQRGHPNFKQTLDFRQDWCILLNIYYFTVL